MSEPRLASQNLWQSLSNEQSEKIAQVNDLLGHISEWRKNDKTIARKLSHRLVKRGTYDRNRRNRLLKHETDPATLTLLSRAEFIWRNEPGRFWALPQTSHLTRQQDPVQFLLDIFRLTKIDDAQSRMVSRSACKSLAEYATKRRVEYEKRLKFTAKKDQATLQLMLSRASSYMILEQHFGRGICLVMGTKSSETTWTRLITKNTVAAHNIIAFLQQTDLPLLAQQYGELSCRLQAHKFIELSAPEISCNLGPLLRTESPGPDNGDCCDSLADWTVDFDAYLKV